MKNWLTGFLYERRFGFAYLLCGLFGIGLLYSLYLGLSYSRPMLQERYVDASGSYAADTPLALYNAGVQSYKAEQYAVAVKTLTAAHNACQSGSGGIPDSRKQLAAEIKFLLGNALVKGGKLKTAVEAYKECLRLDPQNMEAKNNLEFLQQMNGGKGPPDDPNGGGAGNGPRHGI